MCNLLKISVVLAGSLMVAGAAASQALLENRVLTHREQAPIVHGWVEKRFDTLLPGLMRREEIDMWIITSREYNDDPVFRSMAPLTTYASRRRTILVFFDRGGEQPVERLSIGRFDYQGLFEVHKTENDEQWEGLRQVVEERDPEVIGINTSDIWYHGDGLTFTEHEKMIDALTPKYAGRVVSAENLVVGWIEVKLPEQTDMYRHVMRVAHQIIREAFSNHVIVPGQTTTADVEWWMRQRVAELGLGQWFHPSVSIQRRGELPEEDEPDYDVIERGDFLHCDFGIRYLGLATDTQHNAYVLLPGESEAPSGLVAGQRAGHRLQDIIMEKARIGQTGNQALEAALSQAKSEGLNPMIYSHPIGYFGHAPGASIGMTDYQDGIPGIGEFVFRANTWLSIENNVKQEVPEWDGKEVRFALEEDAALLEDGWHWLDGRQSELYLIR